MSSTEDDTYKRLKSLTQGEAIAIFASAYVRVAVQLGQQAVNVPIHLVRDAVDVELKPYGWSYNRIFEMYSYNEFD